MEIVDKRSKVARADQQDYAHIPPEMYEQHKEDYQYQDEDKRVKFHVDSDSEDTMTQDQLYNLNGAAATPEVTVEMVIDPATTEPTNNKIKARLNSQEVLEGHRERAYKVRNRVQIYDKTDPGKEAYLLQNDPRTDEVQAIQKGSKEFDSAIAEEAALDFTDPRVRFAVGSVVKHNEEGIKGRIKFVGEQKIAVIWDDRTRERFSIAEAKSSLEVVEYVDTAQEAVDPLADEVNNMYNDALASMDSEPLDAEKDKLNKQVRKLETQLQTTHISNIKHKAAIELVDLMKIKGLVPANKDAIESQTNLIMAMGDHEYESLKNQVVQGSLTTADLAILNMSVDEVDDEIEDGQEYAQMREAAKKVRKEATRSSDGIEMGDTSFFENGGLASNFRASVGDFSAHTGSDSSTQGPRSIQRKDGSVNEPAKIAAAHSGLDFSGFQNIEGPAKPLNMSGKESSPSTKYSDLFASMQWTTLKSKR